MFYIPLILFLLEVWLYLCLDNVEVSSCRMIILVSCFQGYLIQFLVCNIFVWSFHWDISYIHSFILIFPVSSYSVNTSASLTSQKAITFPITTVLLVSHKTKVHTYCRNENS